MVSNLSSAPYFDATRFFAVKSEHTYTVSVHADMVKIKSDNPPPPPETTSTRGSVSSFSRKSRKRMIEMLADEIRVPDLFITLTWSDDGYSPCMDEYKKNFEAMRRRLERNYKGISAIWRVELEKRKSGAFEGLFMPHVHMLIWLPEQHKKDRDLIVEKDDKHHWAQWWHDITGSTHPEHLRKRGCDIQVIKSRKHGYHYVSKYAAKPADDKLEVGRRWGVIGSVGQGSRADIIINKREYIELKRLIISYWKRRKKWIAKKLSRQSVNVGLTAFGLGVWNSPDYRIDKSTIYKMVEHAKELAADWEDEQWE